jgi:O-Antigen ligase
VTDPDANADVDADPTTHATAALLALAAVAVWLVWAAHDGGFAPEQWLPGALIDIGLLTVLLASRAARQSVQRAGLPALAFGGYVVLSYLSILWAQVRGDALDGANRTLLYWVVFVFFAGAPLTERARLLLTATWAYAVVTIGAVDFLHASTATGPRGFFILGRFAKPISYPNANAALFLMAFLPLQVIASRREQHVAIRATATVGSCLALELALLGQSRGSVVALPLAVVAYFLITRNFLRALPVLLIVAVAAGPTVPSLLHVYRAVVNNTGYSSALSQARWEIAVSSLAAGLAAVAVALADSRVRASARTCRLLRNVLLGSAAAAGIAAVVGVALFAHPLRRAHHAWDNFTTNASAPPETIHIASGVGTSRYDVWRIALNEFKAHPIGGVGSDNYLVGYLRHRRTVETARYPESIELRALSETGLVGALLFFGFLGFALKRGVSAARSESMPNAALAALVATSYWLLHASVDWLWEFPALAAPALGLLGLAVGAARDSRAGSSVSASMAPWRRRAPATAAAVVVAGAAAAILAVTWVSVRQVDEAVALAASRPQRSSALLDQAARWNPLSAQPALTEAAIAANALDRRRERSALRSALRRDPQDWYTHLMLGIVAGQEHRLAAARRELANARRLSPLDPVVIYAQRNLAVGNPLSEKEIGDVFRIRSRTLRGVAQR